MFVYMCERKREKDGNVCYGTFRCFFVWFIEFLLMGRSVGFFWLPFCIFSSCFYSFHTRNLVFIYVSVYVCMYIYVYIYVC